MDLNRYTEKAQEALLRAQGLSQEYGHPQIEPEHILLALLGQVDGVVPAVVLRLENDPQRMAGDLQQLLSRRPKVQGGSAQVGLSPAAARIVQAAEREASGLRDEYISTEHLLLSFTLVI